MYCKNCKHNLKGRCQSKYIREQGGGIHAEPTKEEEDQSLIYDYDEGGGFTVGDYFGCVHWDGSIVNKIKNYFSRHQYKPTTKKNLLERKISSRIRADNNKKAPTPTN